MNKYLRRANRTIAATFGFAAILASFSTAAQAQLQRRIIIQNDCNSAIRLLIRHADGYRNWHMHGWVNIDPYETTGLTSRGQRLTQSDNHTLYFYAESTDSRGYLWDGDQYHEWNGVNYGLRRANVTAQGTELRTRITCSN
jgi:hypothetical protein